MKIKVIGIIAIIAIIGFMVSCDINNNPLGGNETLEDNLINHYKYVIFLE